LPILYEGYKKIFARHGVEVTNEIISREVLGDWEGPSRLGVKDTETFFADFEKEVLEKLNEAKLNPGVLEILKKIKERGGKIGIVTATKKRWAKVALRNDGLRDLVDVFLGKEDVEFLKPNPEGLFKALSFMGGKADESIMIGDNGKDVAAGKAAGMDTGMYFPKRYEDYYSRETQLRFGATMVFEDFSELEKLLG